MIAAGRTDVGRVRARNEDSFVIDTAAGLALVCDGMGGHAGGDVASRTAAQAIADFVAEFGGEPGLDVDAALVNATSIVRSAVQLANQRLLDLNHDHGFAAGRGMGTTVVGLCRAGTSDRLVCFHAGDSRLYRLRDGALEQLTRDHSLYQLWLDQGGKGAAPARNIIVRALGSQPDLEPELGVHALRPGDLFLLCSDGLTAMLPDRAIAEVLAALRHDLEAACTRLVELANERGGIDNVTVVLAAFDS